MEVPFKFKNEVTEDRITLTLNGHVRKRYYDDDKSIDEELIQNAVENAEGKEVYIRLNSPGGDVFEGISIYNYLKSLDNKVTVEVTAQAASAASIIAMGADEIIMATGSSMMIHEASTWAVGNKKDIQKSLQALETVDDSLIDIYQERTGKSREEINDWLTEETYFTAEEAIENGLADSRKTEPLKMSASVKIDASDMSEAFAALKSDVLRMIEAAQNEADENEETKPVATGLNKIFGGK